jgi:hypothetical protein
MPLLFKHFRSVCDVDAMKKLTRVPHIRLVLCAAHVQYDEFLVPSLSIRFRRVNSRWSRQVDERTGGIKNIDRLYQELSA